MKALITLEDIYKFRPLAKDIPFERVSPYILEAQFQDVKPILGDALYYSLLQKFDVTGDALYTVYKELLRGKTYTHGGIEYVFEGLVPCVVYYALAKFAQHNPVHFTASGIVQKNMGEYSVPLTEAGMKALIADLRTAAIAYQEQAIDFLARNASTYTLYSNTEQSFNQSAIKFFDIPNNDYSNGRNKRFDY